MVFILSNIVRWMINGDNRWIPFFASFLVAAIGTGITTKWHPGVIDAIMWVVNGCMLFWSAAGIHDQAINFAQRASAGGVKPQRKPVTQVKFLTPWYKQ